ncbi:MAG: alpha/beta hydrolase, partial [Chitinophagaceae bacterium]|nr:alpha/beta hydrolase [Chitinophagaceae bacterium]
MKYPVIILAIVCFITHNSFSQSLAGITGKADTSYSLYNAFISTKKTHPDTRFVDELKPGSYASKKDVVYCAAGKRKLLLDAFYPKTGNGAKRFAVIIIHGGGWRTGNRTLHYPLAQHLAGRGYVCFTPEYRLSTEALYPAAVYDIKAAIRWVRQHAEEFNIDTAKIAVAGHSAGGELAAYMGATNGKPEFEGSACNIQSPGNVNAVIDIDGILAFIHPESGEGDDSKRTSAATYWFGYSKTENPELWNQASPLTHVGLHTPPVLFLNSSVARMHAGREDFISVLNQYHIYSEV